MAEMNPAGTMFLGLIEALIDLIKKPEVSRVEVVMGSYELDAQGKEKLAGEKNSVALRSFIVRGMNRDVQEQLRRQFEAGPMSYLMILWTERFAKENKMGFLTFNPETKQKSARSVADLDKVEKSAIADYLQRQTKREF